MASRALMQRFIRTWWICVVSADTTHKSRGASSVTVMDFGNVWTRTFSVVVVRRCRRNKQVQLRAVSPRALQAMVRERFSLQGPLVEQVRFQPFMIGYKGDLAAHDFVGIPAEDARCRGIPEEYIAF